MKQTQHTKRAPTPNKTITSKKTNTGGTPMRKSTLMKTNKWTTIDRMCKTPSNTNQMTRKQPTHRHQP
eukprot:12920302-Prorocentrum_lima.AAC.1